MYMMHQGPEPPHHHHLPKMDDDDDDGDYNDHGHGHGHESDEDDHMPQGHPYPPHNGMGHPNQQPPPLATPQQPLQPPKPLFSPNTSRPPSKRRSTPTSTPPPQPQPPPMSMPPPPVAMPPPQQPLQPPQPILHPPPSSPPPKPGRAPPPSGHDDDDDDNKGHKSHLCAVITVLLFLIGLTALILWLLYRPSKPHYTTLGAAVYTLNTTSTPPGIAASLQFTVLTRNPSKRTSIYYDRLVAVVHYRNHPITPPAALPPLHQVKRSAVMMSPFIGGGTPVAVPPELVEGLAADEAYGVVALSWVLVGRVRYKVGWFKSGHSRVYVRCDVIVGFKNSAGEVIKPNNGQLPLLGNPPCFVDI